MEKPSLVVGIDFGTTSTSVAWASTTPPVQIELINTWPTCGPPVGNYVPTEVSYTEGDRAGFAWGYNIQAKSPKIQWFKLGLEADNEILVLPPGVTTAKIVCDYLAAIRRHIMDTLSRRFEESVLGSYEIAFYLTVPAIWSDAAKQKTLNAAYNAGFSKMEIALLSEPECAAIFTLRSMDDVRSRVKANDKFLVCDAGGGTVDVISYEVLQISPRLSVQESAAGTGEFCGSTFIDREFESFFKSRMGSSYELISRPNRQQISRNFEHAKLAFRDSLEQPVFYVPIPGFTNLPHANIVDGNLELSREEMKDLFEPVIAKVLDLLKEQVHLASAEGRSVSSILLVGGFGESEYLFKRINQWAVPNTIRVIQPREARTAIAKGAVTKGLEGNSEYQTEVVRRARRSYGFPTSERFIEGVHSYDDMYTDPHTGQRLAKNQISWFITKNQIIDDQATFKHRFARDFKTPSVWSHLVVSCDLDKPPVRITPQVRQHCTIYSDLGHLRNKFKRRWRKFQTYYTAEYALVMSLVNNNLTVWLEFQGSRYSTQDIVYE